MGVLHPIRRINRLNRSNPLAVRQIESATSSILAQASVIGHIDRYEQTRPDTGPDRPPVHTPRRRKERQRLHRLRPPHLKPGGTAASHSRYRSLPALLLVKCQRSLDHLWKPRPHETHARQRPRNHRERSHLPHSPRPMNPFYFWAKSSSVDHLIGKRDERRRHLDAEHARCFQIDDELKLCGLDDGQIT